GNAEHEGAHQQPLDVRVLVRDIERVAVVARVVAGVGRARLDGVGHQAVVAEGQLGDVRGALDSGVDAILVADGPEVALVAGRVVVHVGGGGGRLGHVGPGGEPLV